VHPHRLDQSKADHHGEHDRTAVAQHGHRHAHDRRQAHDHGAVDEHIDGERRGHASRRQPTKVAVAHKGGAQGHEDGHRIEDQHHHAAHEAELFGQGRENEVGLFLRQEVELAL
jgi:hypothetical protein